VREETDTRIEVPAEGSDVSIITVSGPKDNVDKAREMLESTQKALVSTDDSYLAQEWCDSVELCDFLSLSQL